MKKLLFLFTAGSLFLLTSCGGKKEEGGGTSAATKKNLEASEAIGKMFETKDFSKAGDYLAPDFIDYAGMTGPVKGIEENKKAWLEMMNTMDSSSMETVTASGNDEYTMTLIKMSGKMKVDQMGMKAGDWMKDAKALELTQFKDGKAIAHWTYMDPAAMMKMMPPPPAPVKMEEGVAPEHNPVP
jgi:ketosteroid isomerase-like protein